MLHIDRATDLLVAVCYSPTNARLGEKDGQRAAQPYVFYRLGDDWSSPEQSRGRAPYRWRWCVPRY
jgi:hypothetical protein